MKRNVRKYQKPKIRKESIKVNFYFSAGRAFDSMDPDLNSQLLLAHQSGYCTGICAYCL